MQPKLLWLSKLQRYIFCFLSFGGGTIVPSDGNVEINSTAVSNFGFQNATATSMARSLESVIEKMVIVPVMQILPVKNVIVVLLDFMISRTVSRVPVWPLALKE